MAGPYENPFAGAPVAAPFQPPADWFSPGYGPAGELAPPAPIVTSVPMGAAEQMGDLVSAEPPPGPLGVPPLEAPPTGPAVAAAPAVWPGPFSGAGQAPAPAMDMVAPEGEALSETEMRGREWAPGLETSPITGGVRARQKDPLAELAAHPDDARELSALSTPELALEAGRREAAAAKLQAERETEALEQYEADVRESARITREADAAADKAEFDLNARTEANIKSEPDRRRWWNDSSTGEKIAAVLAAWAGGLLAPYQGGKNQGLELIKGIMEKDMDIQEQGIERERRFLELERSGLSEKRNRIGVDDARRTERLVTGFKIVQQKLAADMARLDPAGTAYARTALMARQAQDEIDKEMRNYRLQQRQVAIAGANSRREQERHEYEMRERDAKWTAVAMKGLNDFNRNVAILQGKVKPDPYEGLDPETAAKMKRDDYIRNTETTAKSPALRDKAGNQVQFRDKDERKTFEEYHDASAIVIGNLNRILELRKNMSTWEKTQPAKFSEAQAEINSLLGQTLPLYNANIDRLGAMDKGVQEIFEKQAGDPTSVFDAKAVTPITTMRDRLRDRYRKKAETAVPELDLSQQEFLHDSPTSAIGESARVTVAGLDSPDAGTALGSLRSISTVMGDNPSLSGDPTFRKNLDKAIKTVEKSGTPEQKKELVQRKGEIENVEDTRQRLIIKQAMEDNPGHFWPLMGPNLGLLVEGDHPSIRPKRKKLVEAIERGKLKSGNIYDILGEGGIFQPE